jgi:hypothetical protein
VPKVRGVKCIRVPCLVFLFSIMNYFRQVRAGNWDISVGGGAVYKCKKKLAGFLPLRPSCTWSGPPFERGRERDWRWAQSSFFAWRALSTNPSPRVGGHVACPEVHRHTSVSNDCQLTRWWSKEFCFFFAGLVFHVHAHVRARHTGTRRSTPSLYTNVHFTFCFLSPPQPRPHPRLIHHFVFSFRVLCC